MKKPVSLIVTDSGPLITLALVDRLDLLLSKENIHVFVPDMVRFEILRNMEKPGAAEISEWIRANEPDRVSVSSTEVYEEFQILLSARPETKSKNRGELAAAEVLERELVRGDRIGILLFEDKHIRKNTYIVRAPNNVLMVSTGQFLHNLQKANIIPSADEILDRAAQIRGAEIKNRHQMETPGAEERKDDWHEDFSP